MALVALDRLGAPTATGSRTSPGATPAGSCRSPAARRSRPSTGGARRAVAATSTDRRGRTSRRSPPAHGLDEVVAATSSTSSTARARRSTASSGSPTPSRARATRGWPPGSPTSPQVHQPLGARGHATPCTTTRSSLARPRGGRECLVGATATRRHRGSHARRRPARRVPRRRSTGSTVTSDHAGSARDRRRRCTHRPTTSPRCTASREPRDRRRGWYVHDPRRCAPGGSRRSPRPT